MTAALFITALLLMRQSNNSNIKSMRLWVGHAAVYWSVVSIAKLFFGYTGPSELVSLWGAIIYLQAPVTIIGSLLLKRKYHA